MDCVVAFNGIKNRVLNRAQNARDRIVYVLVSPAAYLLAYLDLKIPKFRDKSEYAELRDFL